MELDQETYRMIVETNTMVKALNDKLQSFVGDVNHCLKSHDERIREVEVKGSLPSREASSKVEVLEKRVAELESFKDTHEGEAKASRRDAAIITTVLGLLFYRHQRWNGDLDKLHKMTQLLTVEQLQAKFDELQIGCHREIFVAMEKAALNVEGRAKKNATPGHSPYEDMDFPTKVDQANRENRVYSGAPYSLDNPSLLHMRDTIESMVDEDQEGIHGYVFTPKDYAYWVHEGTSRMWARPFIYDAVMSEHNKTMRILEDGLEKAIADVCK